MAAQRSTGDGGCVGEARPDTLSVLLPFVKAEKTAAEAEDPVTQAPTKEGRPGSTNGPPAPQSHRLSPRNDRQVHAASHLFLGHPQRSWVSLLETKTATGTHVQITRHPR